MGSLGVYCYLFIYFSISTSMLLFLFYPTFLPCLEKFRVHLQEVRVAENFRLFATISAFRLDQFRNKEGLLTNIA